jgi:hypothetical protein
MSLNAPLPQGDTPNWGTLYNNAIQEIRTRIAALGESSISESELDALRTQLQNLINSTEQGLQNQLKSVSDDLQTQIFKQHNELTSLMSAIETELLSQMGSLSTQIMNKADKRHTHESSDILDLQTLFVDVSNIEITLSQLSQSLDGYTFFLGFTTPIPVVNIEVGWRFAMVNGIAGIDYDGQDIFFSNRISLPLLDPNSSLWSSNDTSARAEVRGDIIVRNPFNGSQTTLNFVFIINKYHLPPKISVDDIVSQIVNDSNFAMIVSDRIAQKVITDSVTGRPRD